MDWITLDVLTTVAGASAAVTLVTGIVKQFGCTTGRKTQLIAAVLSLAIVLVIKFPGTAQDGLLSLLNAAVVLAASMGWDQLFNYKR